MKQTSVQFIFDAVYRDIPFSELLGIIAQAKEMEKQQIFDAQSYAISLLKQTTEYEVLDSWKQKVKELEQFKKK
jgi:hypothetical protein